MPRKSASSLPDPTDLESGELRKSADTRRRIMDATVHCLAHFGYAGTNAITVAELAKMTRSALLYHFPTRMDLIGAAIHYVTLRRIEMFEVAMSKIEPGHDRVAEAIDEAWRQNQTEEYRAYSELSNAAHTDPDLAAVFRPAMAAYDLARRKTAMALFSAQEKRAEGFHLRRDVTRFLLDGLATHGWFGDDGDTRAAQILQFLKVLAREPEGRRLLAKAARDATARPLRGEALKPPSRRG